MPHEDSGSNHPVEPTFEIVVQRAPSKGLPTGIVVDGDYNCYLQVKRSDTIDDVKNMIEEAKGIPADDIRIVVEGKPVDEGWRTLSSIPVTSKSKIYMVPKVRGGGFGVVKKHLKKEDAVKALKTRTEAFILKSDIKEGDVSMPADFKAFLENVKKEANTIVAMKRNGGDNIIQLGLKTVSTENLQMLIDIMDSKSGGRRGTSEERVLKMVSVMFPTMVMLDGAKSIITDVQEKMMADFAGIYIEECNSYSAGSAKFNNDLFIKHVQKELDMREGQASATQTTGSNCIIS